MMYVCPGCPGSVRPLCYLHGAESARRRKAGPLDWAGRCASPFLSPEFAYRLPGGRLHGERTPTPRISTGVPIAQRDLRGLARQRRGGCGHGPVRLARDLWSAPGSPSWDLCFGRSPGGRTDRIHPSRGRPAIPSAGRRLHPQAGGHLGIGARIRGRWKGYRGNRPDVRRTDLPSRSLHHESPNHMSDRLSPDCQPEHCATGIAPESTGMGTSPLLPRRSPNGGL